MEPLTLQEYHVFLASPGDLNEERQIVRDYFDYFNRGLGRTWNVRFQVIDWENYSSVGIGRAQEIITHQTLEQFKDSLPLVIGLMGQRFGSPTGDYESGTEEEFNWAIDHWKKHSWPEIKWFFKEIKEFKSDPDPSKINEAYNQYTKVLNFKKKIHTETPQLYYREFSDCQNLKDILNSDLNQWLTSSERPWVRAQSQEHPFDNVKLFFDFSKLREAYRIRYNHLNIDCLATTCPSDSMLFLWDLFIPQAARLCESYIPRKLELPIELRRKLLEKGEIAPCEELEEDDKQELQRRYFKTSPSPIVEVVQDESNHRLIILGDPGSGKSCLLRYLAINADIFPCDIKESERLPLYIELKEYHRWQPQHGEKTLLRYCAEAPSFPYPVPEKIIKACLAENINVILLLDGLDEIFDIQDRRDVVEACLKYCVDTPAIKFIVTSRVIGFNEGLFRGADFRIFMLQDFEPEQIEMFIQRWHEQAISDAQDRKEKLSRLRQSITENKRIRELAGNPLLLTMLAILNRRQKLPRFRAELYNQCSRVLLDLWQTEGRHLLDAFPELKQNGIDVRDKRAILQAVAYKMQIDINSRGNTLINEADLEDLIFQYLEKLGNLESPKKLTRVLVRELREINFVLCFVGARGYAFVHRTFLEYFCALEIAERYEKRRILTEENLITEVYGRWSDENWHETLCLLSGMIDELVVGKIINYLLELPNTEDCEFKNIFLCAKIFQEVRNQKALEPYREKLCHRLGILSKWEFPFVFHLFDDENLYKNHIQNIQSKAIISFITVSGTNNSTFILLRDTIYHRSDGFLKGIILKEVVKKWQESISTSLWIKDRAQNDDDLIARQVALEQLCNAYKEDPDTLNIIKNHAFGKLGQIAIKLLVNTYKDDPDTLIFLKDYVRTDKYHYPYNYIEENIQSDFARGFAIEQLVRIFKEDPDTLSIIKNCAQNDKNHHVRQIAVKQLGRAFKDDPDTLNIIKDRASNDNHGVVRWGAASQLAETYKDDPYTLTFLKDRAQNDSKEFIRNTSIKLIARSFKDNPDTLIFLKDLALNDNNFSVCKTAIEQLIKNYNNDPITLSFLKGYYHRIHNKFLRGIAIEQLAGAFKNDPGTLPFLKDCAHDDDDFVRQAAVEQLAKLFKNDPDTLTIIKNCSKNDKDDYVRVTAVAALAGVFKDDPETLIIIKDRLQNDEDDWVRETAARCLIWTINNDIDTMNCLKNCIKNDSNLFVRQTAIILLATSFNDDPDVLIFLKDCARNHETDEVRGIAIEQLSRSFNDDPETLTILKNCAQSDSSDAVRGIAINQLIRAFEDDPDTLPLLKDRVQNHEIKLARGLAVKQLAKVFKNVPDTLTVLKNLARYDGENYIRKIAVEQLNSLFRGDADAAAIINDHNLLAISE